MSTMYTVMVNEGNFSASMSRLEAIRYAKTMKSVGNDVKMMTTLKANRLQEVMECAQSV